MIDWIADFVAGPQCGLIGTVEGDNSPPVEVRFPAPSGLLSRPLADPLPADPLPVDVYRRDRLGHGRTVVYLYDRRDNS